MTLEILSPERTLFSGEVESVTLPGALGEFTVLRNHAALVSTLTAGNVTYRSTDDNELHSVEISGGIADVDNNIVSVCIY